MRVNALTGVDLQRCWLVGGMGLRDWNGRRKEMEEKEHSQESERKGCWGEKGEGESRERGKIQRVEECLCFDSPVHSVSTYLLGASHRARQWGYGSIQRRQSLYFYKTYLELGEVNFQRVTMSHSKSQIVISAMKETNQGLREPLSRLMELSRVPSLNCVIRDIFLEE